MEKFERKIGTLTTKNIEVFRKLKHCLEAGRLAIDETAKVFDKGEIRLDTARSFIREILFELEARKDLEMKVWDSIKVAHNLTDDEYLRLHVNEDNGDIRLLTKEYFESSHNGAIDIKRFNLMWEKA